VSELYDENGLQRYYEDSARSGAALHMHRDSHQLQDLLPLREGSVRQLKQAWRLFVLGLIVGRIRVDQPSADDETRFHYVYRRPVSAFEQRWESLGPEMGAIHRLVDDSQLMQTLSRDVEESRNALEQRGLWGELSALADYYFHCIYPVRKDRVGLKHSAGVDIVGSVENEAVNEIRDEVKQRAHTRGGLDAAELAKRTRVAVHELAKWARPVARMSGRASPWTLDLRAEDREFEWSLLDEVREHLAGVQGIAAARNALGEVEAAFPRLRIDDDSVRVDAGASLPPQPAPSSAGVRFHYAGPSGRKAELAVDDVAALVREQPGAAHKVWRTGYKAWVSASDEPAIAALLADVPPPLDDDDAPYEVARDKERLGQKSATEVAALVVSGGVVKVWRKGWPAWKPALEVEAIRALVPDDGPPPLDDDEPPPL
jgi:hypothetical protein